MPLSMTTSTFPLGVVSAQLGLFSFCATGHMCAHLICSKCMCRSDREHFYFFFYMSCSWSFFSFQSLCNDFSKIFKPSPLSSHSLQLSTFSMLLLFLLYFFFICPHPPHCSSHFTGAGGGGYFQITFHITIWIKRLGKMRHKMRNVVSHVHLLPSLLNPQPSISYPSSHASYF